MRHTLNTEEQYTVEAHGKLLLFGEYLALFGFGACGMPLPMYTRAQFVRSHTDKSLKIVSRIAIPSEFYAHVVHVCHAHHVAPLAGTITIESEIPLSAGFGSSAALCTCISKIIVRENPQLLCAVGSGAEEPQLQMTWSIAHSLEHFFHCTASGIDTALALYTCPLLFVAGTAKNNTTPSHLQIIPYKGLRSLIPLEKLIVAYTPRSPSTTQGENIKLISQQIQSYLNTQDKSIVLWNTYHNEVMKILIESAEGRSTTPSGELAQVVGEYARRIHRELTALKITSPVTDDLLSFLFSQGALGGKMSGAGLGGAFYGLTKDCDQKNRVIAHLQEHVRANKISGVTLLHRLAHT